jgi:hypothetical protein
MHQPLKLTGQNALHGTENWTDVGTEVEGLKTFEVEGI